MSLLTICQDAASQLGLRRPSFIVGSQDLMAQQMLRLVNQTGAELMKAHGWQNLVVEVSATTTATVVQSGLLPSASYHRMAYNAEIWNRTTNQRYSGPTPQRAWVQLRTGVSGGVAGWWRILGNDLHIFPAPSTGQVLNFEYIDKRFAASALGVSQAVFQADSDVPRIADDELFTLGLVWRWRHSKGLPQYAEDFATFEREKERAMAADRASGRIRTDAGDVDDLPSQPGWDGSITV